MKIIKNMYLSIINIAVATGMIIVFELARSGKRVKTPR